MNQRDGELHPVADSPQSNPVAPQLADVTDEPRTRYDRPATAIHLTPAERAARGKAARSEVPRSSHAVFVPPTDRPDPVALLEQQAESRVPELVPVRYGRMLASPFAFYRGAALIMASDLATTPRSGLRVQACGDAHLSNFGAFASPERQLVFDINDFDETAPGPWEWDVKRLAASFEVAARQNGFRGKDRRAATLGVVRAYREAMATFARMRNLEVWYAYLDIASAIAEREAHLDVAQRKRVERNLSKTRTRDSLQAFEKLTGEVDGRRRILAQPPLIVPLEDVIGESHTPQEVEEGVREILRGYRRSLQSDRQHLLEQFEYLDTARKVVGVGSVGTRAFIVLLQGRDSGDPLFLQVKEAQPSVLERYVGASRYTHAGERVVAGQRLMQAASDIFLGWIRATGVDGVDRDFYVRQLRDWKGSALVEEFGPESMLEYSRFCGWTLAKAHARSGDRIAISSYLGTSDVFDNAVADFAATYADQNERDYAALQEAVGSGRLTAATEE